MNDIAEKANLLRETFASRSATPPAMRGTLLAELPHKDGRIRVSWDTYEGHPFLSVRLWTGSEDGTCWPSKIGFTVKPRDLPALGDAIGKALDLALEHERGRNGDGRP